MDERYEIKGKIGQGGLGAVYRAQDIRMNREVAIKRILTNTDDASIPEEGTRQLIKEAGALASLQHPNIVTIYDVGSDEDGPFVVMELLTGHNLEDIIAKGSFTWPDFRQLAMQTLEALIAAQELHLVHRDLKPSNIMLTWLPSGKFQVKVVDFGLAKLSAKPSLQTIDQSDGVFGSIYFMAPEQFERVPIDLKADLYAIGCVFYYALTGTYPFDGDNAAQVMGSHLQHHVEPLKEVREGIPVWACDWVMWHINRKPSDRPASAHESLMLFVKYDEYANAELSTGKPAPAPEQPKRPRILMPGSAAVPEVVRESATSTQSIKTASMPKPLAPPAGSKPSVHTAGQLNYAPASDGNPELSPPGIAAQQVVAGGAPARQPARVARPSNSPTSALKRPTAPVDPITGSKPIHAAAANQPGISEETSESSEPHAHSISPAKKGLPARTKKVIASVISLVVMIFAIILIKKSGNIAELRDYNEMVNKAAVEGATDIPVNKSKLEILIRKVTDIGADKDRNAIYKALSLAKSTDGTDVDSRIAELITNPKTPPNIRVGLIRDALGKRTNPTNVSTLLRFARSTGETEAAVAAIEATGPMVTDVNFEDFIEIIRNTKEDQILKMAEKNAAEIIEKFSSKSSMRETLVAKSSMRDKLIVAYSSAANDAIRHSMLRLLGRVGGDKALEIARNNLKSADVNDKIAAIEALGSWGDRDGYLALITFLKSATDPRIRERAFDSAFQYAVEHQTDSTSNWTMLADESKSQQEQIKLINGLGNLKFAPWIIEILQKIAGSSSYNEAVDHAERVIIRIKGQR